MKNAVIALLGLVVLIGLAAQVSSESSFVNMVPNASKTGCQTCHVNPGGGAPWNVFGQQVRANLTGGQPDWGRIYDLDADEDGATNGLELGDPDGTWIPGDPQPGDPDQITHPGDPESRPEPTAAPTASWGQIKSSIK